MNTFIDIAKQKINESYKKNEITNEGLYHYLFDILTEADKAIQVQARVMLNFANIQKEFEEKFCYSFMENGEKRINNIMWKSCDTANDVWEWFEQKLKEASKISV